jgi:hypothetical protein
MPSIKEKIKAIEETEAKMKRAGKQYEKERKKSRTQRNKLEVSMKAYMLELIPKLKWEVDKQTSLYGAGRLIAELDDEIFSAYMKTSQSSGFYFKLDDLRFNFYPEGKQAFLGHIDTYEQVQVLRNFGIEVGINILTSVKKNHEYSLKRLQERIDLWTLKKVESLE